MNRPGDSFRRPANSDPRAAGGSIVGPGGPRDRFGVLLDTARAVLLDDIHVTAVEPTRGGEPVDEHIYGIALGGKINQSPDRASVLYLTDEDGAVTLVAEILALAARRGRAAEVMAAIDRQWTKLREDDAAGPNEGSAP